MKSLFLLMLVPPLSVAAHAVPLQLWVAPNGDDAASGTQETPFATPEKARDEARRQKPKDGAIVNLRGGVYRLAQTLELDESDGNVTFRAAPGETPIFDGGQLLSNWKKSDKYRLWTHELAAPVRQLWKDATPLQMVRWPSEDVLARLFDEDSQSVQLPPDGLEWLRDENNWRGLTLQIDSHFAPMTVGIGDIESAPNGDLRVLPLPRQRARLFDFVLSHSVHRAPYRAPLYFEGGVSLLNRPGGKGSWACETTETGARLWLSSGSAPSKIVAPRLQTLVSIRGQNKPVGNIRFEGISFQHAGWNGLRDGFISMQAFVEWGTQSEQMRRAPGAVEVENARDSSFSNCLFRENGTHGLVFKKATQSCLIENNRFLDLSGGGIVIESLDLTKPSRNDVVKGNYIRRIGLEMAGNAGIFGGYCDGIRIENNDIGDCPYSGISLGWGWLRPNDVAANNLVKGNRIARVVNRLDDGAGIYLLGIQPGTRVEENFLRDIARPDRSPTRPMPAAAIYLDEGSTGVTVKNNRIINCPQPFHFNRNGADNVVEDNLVNGQKWQPAS